MNTLVWTKKMYLSKNLLVKFQNVADFNFQFHLSNKSLRSDQVFFPKEGQRGLL